MNELSFAMNGICGMGLHFVFDGFRITYVLIACFMWGMTALLSPEYFKHYTNKARYYVFFWITFFALCGVFLSADLFTTFVFFEIMSFTSYVWVAQDERDASLRAAMTYLAVAVIGGLVMLMGLFLMYNGGYNRYLTYGLIFFGFAAKAGVFPLHIWLPKAHPVAPAPASALLSGILTKSGIYGILILSYQLMNEDVPWGLAMLILGLITMVLGAVLALFSIDLKRTLACSSMSQIGFIMTGVGMGCMLGGEGILPRNGTIMYMINHSLLKLLLFMSAGVVYFNLHKLDINEIRGFGRKKPLLRIAFLLGVLGISGVPFFNGYLSKTLLHESFEEIVPLVSESFVGLAEWIFIISGGCTLAYMTKLFIAVFVEKNADDEVQKKYDENKKYISPLSSIALVLSAIVIPVFGMLPHFTIDKIVDQGAAFLGVEELDWYISYFSFKNIKGSLVSIVIGVLVYLVFVRKVLMKDGQYVDRWPKALDLENSVYRPLLLNVLPFIGTVFARTCEIIIDGFVVLVRKFILFDRTVPREFAEGTFLTHVFGGWLDFIKHIREGHYPDNRLSTFEHRLAIRHFRRNLNFSLISRSLSYGLVLACLGLLFTMGYLLSFII